MMQFRILGSLEARRRLGSIALGGAKQRAVLAILLLHRGEVVSVDRIVDELWGERRPTRRPRRCRSTSRGFARRWARACWSPAAAATRSRSTRTSRRRPVRAPRAEGREALDRGDAAGRASLLRRRSTLWRGPPLADFAYEPFAQTEIARLEELRLLALEDRIEADLALGRHAAPGPGARDPGRASTRRASGCAASSCWPCIARGARPRRSRATGTRDGRSTRSSGSSPAASCRGSSRRSSPRTRRSTRRPRRAPVPRRRRPRRRPDRVRRRLLLAAAVAAIVAAGTRLRARARDRQLAGRDRSRVQSGRRHRADRRAAGRRLGRRRLRLGRKPRRRHRDPGRPERQDGRQHDLDPAERRRGWPRAPAASGSATAAGRGLVRLDPDFTPWCARSGRAGTRRIRPVGTTRSPSATARSGRARVWRHGARRPRRATRSRGRSRSATARARSPPAPAASGSRRRGQHRDPDRPRQRGRRCRDPSVGQGPTAVAVGEGAVWVANTQDDTVSRIDPRTAAVTQTIPVGRRPTGVAAGDGAVWVANSLERHRLDESTRGRTGSRRPSRWARRRRASRSHTASSG